MVEIEFENVAKEEGATFILSEDKLNTGTGVFISDLTYSLTVNYKQKKIYFSNRTGASAVGKISCNICQPKDSLTFRLTTRSHFSSLFYRKNRFNLNSRNPNIDVFFRNSIAMAKLKEIAKNTSFEPTILGINTEGSYKLVIEYSLHFSDWHQVIRPIILFYKEFIDKFDN